MAAMTLAEGEALCRRWVAERRAPPGVAELLAAIDHLRDENARLREALLSLLARIHRDGGHHTESVGLARSVYDADNRVAELNAAVADRTELAARRWLDGWASDGDSRRVLPWFGRFRAAEGPYGYLADGKTHADLARALGWEGET